MEKHKITFDGKDYEVGEPTLRTWGKLNLTKDTMDTKEFALNLITSQTGLNRGQLLQCDWYDIHNVSDGIMSHLNMVEDTFHKTFEFKGKTYQFVDLESITFGEFVDLDTYLQKSEIEKIQRLNYYMAILYRPIDEEGYDIVRLKERAELFEDLPVKYFFGSNKVFFSLDGMLLRSTKAYFLRMKVLYQMKMMMYRLVVFMVGIPLFLHWLMKMSQRLRRLPKSLLNWLSTTWDTLNPFRKKKINNLKNK